MDYSFLDALFDSVFVLNEEKGIVYCNEVAANLCESSVRRLTKGKVIHDVITFSQEKLFLMPNGDIGKDSVFPMTELNFKLVTGDKAGKGQLTIFPFSEPEGAKRWICILRDVSLEEVLHAKYHAQLEKLEAYNRNLEQMVEERTLEVKRANFMLKAIMNSLGQGFLVFDSAGVCGNVYTKACEDVLEAAPVGQQIWDVLRLSDKDRETFKMWMTAVFGQKLSFDSLKDLAPSAYAHSKGRNIKLDYFPIQNESGQTSHLVLVATDWTAEFEANQALEKERHFAKMVVKFVTNKDQFKKFLDASVVDCQSVLNAVENSPSGFDHEWAFRVLHTIEGEAGTFGLESIRKASRLPQEALEPLKKNASNFSEIKSQFVEGVRGLMTVRESFIQENQELFDAVGLTKNDTVEVGAGQLQKAFDYLKQKGVSAPVIEFVQNILYSRPVLGLFKHFDDTVAVVAEKLNKKIAKIHWQGMDTLVRHEYLSELAGSFVHVFRNMVDHGIEPSEDRVMMGKDEVGHINVRFAVIQKNGQDWYQIRAADDGQGIYPETIRKKMASMGRPLADQLSDKDVLQVIFDSGFSTRANVGEYSGRGIGMNAVLEEAKRLGGHAYMESVPGQGSTLVVEVPVNHKDEGLQRSA